MHGLGAIDPGKTIDWGNTTEDYAKYRPDPPQTFYDKLRALDVGLPEQSILDLGTGTGVLAREFAKRAALGLSPTIQHFRLCTGHAPGRKAS